MSGKSIRVSGHGLRVPRRRAEDVRRRLLRLDLLDRDLKPVQLGEHVVFPLKSVERVGEVLGGADFEVIRCEFEPRRLKPRSLREALRGRIPDELLEYVPSSYDLIGDLILVEIPDELKEYSKIIGEALLKLHPRARSVLSRGKTVGEYRVRLVEVIAGSGDTETVYREHGCVYKLDLRKVFFNPRLSGERLRVASLVKPGEVILDMFAGVGTFSILIARRCGGCSVTAIELNPDAYGYLVENIKLNGVEDIIKPVRGDAREVLREVEDEYDRVIMDLPHSSLDFLDVGLRVCKPEGVIHFYGAAESVEQLEERVFERSRSLGYAVEVEHRREVMEIAPRRFTFVLDLRRLS